MQVQAKRTFHTLNTENLQAECSSGWIKNHTVRQNIMLLKGYKNAGYFSISGVLAPRTGFEPAACRLGGDRSIHLSYRGLYEVLLCRVISELSLRGQMLYPVSSRGVYGMARFLCGPSQPGSCAPVRGNVYPLCILPVFFRSVNPKDRFCRKICKSPRRLPGPRLLCKADLLPGFPEDAPD